MTTFEANGSAQNGHIPQSNVDDHLAYFRYLYEAAQQNWYVQKAKETYGYGKERLRLEGVLNPLEDRVAQASNVGRDYAVPLYANYVYPKTDYVLHKYLVPGVENSKQALEKSKNAAATGGTMSLNLAVITTQVGLIASAAAFALFLDGIILTKKTGLTVAGGAIALEQSIEKRIVNLIEQSRNYAKVPAEKFNEYSNSFIDILNAVIDNHLHLEPIEDEGAESSSNIPQRIGRLAHRVVYALKNRTNENLVQPVKSQLNSLVTQMQQNLNLVDIFKQQKHHLQSSVSDLKDKLSSAHLSDSMHELWERVQTEANEYKITPQEALIRSVKRCSFVLNDYLKKLKQQTSEILPTGAAQRLDLAASHAEELLSNLEHSDDIYSVQDEVLQKAKKTLEEINGWAKSLVSRNETDGTDLTEDSATPLIQHANGTLNNSSFESQHDTSASSESN